eukprot:365757-Chlamydomonas_euryale.AAC.1
MRGRHSDGCRCGVRTRVGRVKAAVGFTNAGSSSMRGRHLDGCRCGVWMCGRENPSKTCAPLPACLPACLCPPAHTGTLMLPGLGPKCGSRVPHLLAGAYLPCTGAAVRL